MLSIGLGARQIVSVVISSGASKLDATLELLLVEVVVFELIRAGRSVKTTGSSDLLQSEMVDFEFIARSCSLLLAVSESKFRELECVEEIALSLSEKSSICGRGLVEETVSLELVLYVTGSDSSFA